MLLFKAQGAGRQAPSRPNALVSAQTQPLRAEKRRRRCLIQLGARYTAGGSQRPRPGASRGGWA